MAALPLILQYANPTSKRAEELKRIWMTESLDPAPLREHTRDFPETPSLKRSNSEPLLMFWDPVQDLDQVIEVWKSFIAFKVETDRSISMDSHCSSSADVFSEPFSSLDIPPLDPHAAPKVDKMRHAVFSRRKQQAAAAASHLPVDPSMSRCSICHDLFPSSMKKFYSRSPKRDSAAISPAPSSSSPAPSSSTAAPPMIQPSGVHFSREKSASKQRQPNECPRCARSRIKNELSAFQTDFAVHFSRVRDLLSPLPPFPPEQKTPVPSLLRKHPSRSSLLKSLDSLRTFTLGRKCTTKERHQIFDFFEIMRMSRQQPEPLQLHEDLFLHKETYSLRPVSNNNPSFSSTDTVYRLVHARSLHDVLHGLFLLLKDAPRNSPQADYTRSELVALIAIHQKFSTSQRLMQYLAAFIPSQRETPDQIFYELVVTEFLALWLSGFHYPHFMLLHYHDADRRSIKTTATPLTLQLLGEVIPRLSSKHAEIVLNLINDEHARLKATTMHAAEVLHDVSDTDAFLAHLMSADELTSHLPSQEHAVTPLSRAVRTLTQLRNDALSNIARNPVSSSSSFSSSITPSSSSSSSFTSERPAGSATLDVIRNPSDLPVSPSSSSSSFSTSSSASSIPNPSDAKIAPASHAVASPKPHLLRTLSSKVFSTSAMFSGLSTAAPPASAFNSNLLSPSNSGQSLAISASTSPKSVRFPTALASPPPSASLSESDSLPSLLADYILDSPSNLFSPHSRANHDHLANEGKKSQRVKKYTSKPTKQDKALQKKKQNKHPDQKKTMTMKKKKVGLISWPTLFKSSKPLASNRFLPVSLLPAMLPVMMDASLVEVKPSSSQLSVFKDPTVLARHLCWMERHIFCRIPMRIYLVDDFAARPMEDARLSPYLQWHFDLSRFFLSELMRIDERSKRVRAFRCILDAAKQCLLELNWASFFLLVCLLTGTGDTNTLSFFKLVQPVDEVIEWVLPGDKTPTVAPIINIFSTLFSSHSSSYSHDLDLWIPVHTQASTALANRLCIVPAIEITFKRITDISAQPNEISSNKWINFGKFSELGRVFAQMRRIKLLPNYPDEYFNARLHAILMEPQKLAFTDSEIQTMCRNAILANTVN